MAAHALVSWIPQHLLLGAWRVGLYRPSKTWDQSCWWWALQGQVPKNSPNHEDEVWKHMKEMLEVGAIHLSQSQCCNAVVLVHQKDTGLHFWIDFHKLNARTKKDSYLLPWIQEAIESLVGAGYLSCLDLKTGSWQIAIYEASKQYIAFTMGNLGFFECKCMPFGQCNAQSCFKG